MKSALIGVFVTVWWCVVSAQKNCVKWGNTFDVSLESGNVIRNCELPDKRKICCAAVDNTTVTRGVGASYIPLDRAGDAGSSSSKGRSTCTVQKKYVSSPQELRELAEADRIERIPGDKDLYVIEDRFHALMKYVTSEGYIRNSTMWLERVKVHMSGVGEVGVDSPIDREYLSRFEFTRTCSPVGGSGEASVTTWTEWIEPIGITARHPFGFGKCRQAPAYYNAGGAHNTDGKNKPRVGRSDVDYVLLQSGASLHKQTHTAAGKRMRTTGKPAPQNKHYLFDAGTSTFDSSLFWFTCAFSQVLLVTVLFCCVASTYLDCSDFNWVHVQRGVSFDQVFGWEMTLLEPVDYWRRVPPRWKPFWHFHNVPVHSSVDSPDSPLRFIQQLAGPQDFVAFKLDIDNPDMEMPIALMLRDRPEVFSLVDEFFFELHFRYAWCRQPSPVELRLKWHRNPFAAACALNF